MQVSKEISDLKLEVEALKQSIRVFKNIELIRWILVVTLILGGAKYFRYRADTNRANIELNKGKIDSLKVIIKK